MRIEISKIAGVNPKHFNFRLRNSFQVQSVYHTDTLVVVIGDFTTQQEQEIIDLYNNTNTMDWTIDSEYMEDFLTEKYELNKIAGANYINRVSAKINLIVQSGLVTVEEAEEYGENTNEVRSELSDGYWHSAYFKHIAYTPINELASIHEEVRVDIRDYVNDKYPQDFQIP